MPLLAATNILAAASSPLQKYSTLQSHFCCHSSSVAPCVLILHPCLFYGYRVVTFLQWASPQLDSLPGPRHLVLLRFVCLLPPPAKMDISLGSMFYSFGIRPVRYRFKDPEWIKDIYRGTTVLLCARFSQLSCILFLGNVP
jgi:hypothetical protein